MMVLDLIRNDTIDLDPAEFIKMKQECPEEITEVQILPPILGKSKDFGKIRVKLSTPRYEVKL
ncbi:MAG: hypothetical protein LBT08_03705 [Synergistaceae bacterium]|jgi:hypothetical protein|nr:hypothetical protein [Synergistaceae bacterium]